MSSPVTVPTRIAARGDLACVVALTALTFAAASAFELHEWLARLELRFERWQLDEWLLTVTVLAVGLAWTASRRRRESLRLLAHNRELAQQMIALQESERRALARELHDELAQHCTALRIEAAYMQRARELAQDPAQLVASAQRAAVGATSLCDSIHGLLRRLRPAELDELGLVAALESMCASSGARAGIACGFDWDGDDATPFDDAVATALYRVAQEAVSNAVRHARAGAVRVSLAGGTTLRLSVVDDGCGFDVASRTRGLGLLGASERAAALGGVLDVRSALGAGTTLRLRLPARPSPAGHLGRRAVR